MGYNLKKLNPSHRIVMRIYMQGKSRGEIAEATGFTENYVSMVVGDPTFQEVYRAMQEELDREFISGERDKLVEDPVRERMRENALAAVEKVIELLNAKSETVAQKSAFDILDRAGYKAEEKLKTELEVNLSKKTESALEMALSEMGVDMSPKEFIIQAVKENNLIGDGSAE